MKTIILKFFFCLVILTPTLYANVPEENLTQCINLPVEYNTLNIPTTKLMINGESIEFVIDLGKKQALTLDKTLVKSLTDDSVDFYNISHSDLTGEHSKIQTGTLPAVILNGMLFENIGFDIYSPWGLWMNTNAQKNNLPNNTIGRDLFLNKKGILYYSRQNKNLHWCKTDHVDLEKISKNIIWLPLNENEEGIHLTTQHQGKELDFVLDSAATVTLIKPYPWINFKANNTHPETKDLVYINDLYVNNHPITTLAYKYSLPNDFNADGLIGDSFFQHTDLIIDTVNNKLGLALLDMKD